MRSPLTKVERCRLRCDLLDEPFSHQVLMESKPTRVVRKIENPTLRHHPMQTLKEMGMVSPYIEWALLALTV